MASLFDHDVASVAREDLAGAVRRLAGHALGTGEAMTPRQIRELALEIIACADRVEMAEAIVALDDDGDDAFTRFMEGDEANDLATFTG